MIKLTALSIIFGNRDIWDNFRVRITVDISKLDNLSDLTWVELDLSGLYLDNTEFEILLNNIREWN